MILCLRKEEISGRFRRFKGKDSVLWGWRGRVPDGETVCCLLRGTSSLEDAPRTTRGGMTWTSISDQSNVVSATSVLRKCLGLYQSVLCSAWVHGMHVLIAD